MTATERDTETGRDIAADEVAAMGEFAGLVMGDLGSAASAAMAVLGDRLGLFKAMAESGPVTSSELAARTGYAERYIREWLCSQAAAGWIMFDEETERFELPGPRAAVLVDEACPAFMGASIQLLSALYASLDRLTETFRSGAGIGWGEHHADLHEGTARFSRAFFPGLLPGLIETTGAPAQRLREGGRILDLGCGQGSLLVALAQAYPDAAVDGVDSHPGSVVAARRRVTEAGLDGRVTVRVAEAERTSTANEGSYDLVLVVDALHDMGDPVGALSTARQALAPDGAVLIVEPLSSDRAADNFNPVGRYYYAISTAFCMPSALSQPGGWALGNQAGPARVLDICAQAGLLHVQTHEPLPFNMVFTARP